MDGTKENAGLSLLKKGQKGIVRLLFSRAGLILALLLVQVLFLLSIFLWFREFLPHIYGGSILFTLVMVLYLLNSSIDPSAKLTWLAVILLLPVFGSLLFLYIQSDVGHRTLKKRVQTVLEETDDLVPPSPGAEEELTAACPGAAALARYIRKSGCYPVFRSTDVTYFPLGEDKFEEMLRQLEAARHFIFLEYFIVDEGLMWGRVLEILARKAAAGVEVRVMYDGTCEFSTLPHDYPKRLEQLGIRCKMFAPVTPFVSTHYNYRDHRKILVIDGHTAFNGGVNLADEYINRREKHGHWKDTAVMVRGEAARSFTLMFLQMWALDEKTTDFAPYLQPPAPVEAPGFVLPYGDCPVDKAKVGELVYMDLLNRAQDHVYIMTPYLILDGEMETALRFAAERGVDVRLILPGVPDKKLPYALAWTHYAALLAAGVKLYEYTPGFVHAKVFVCDGREAVVGTINLDYRSLYHHFECATYLYGTACIPAIEADFLQTQQQCRAITPALVRQAPRSRQLLGILMKGLAPLM